AEEVLETHGAKAKLTAQFAELLSSVPDFDDDYELQRSLMAAVLKRAREIRGEC
ncbi:citrate synthase, partial [Mycolicibacterium canariasense]